MRSLLVLLAVPGVLLTQETTNPRLFVHGYLTQAYGSSRGGLVTGLGDEGTADYRRAAVLARFDVSASDRFVVQVAHRRLGDSPTMQFEDNVKLDMAFYEHRFGTGTSVRVGKSVLPFGIYNETRYAGTLLPFYRAPLSVYWEGRYTPETMDGVVASHRFRSGEAWELSADLFAGGYDFLEFGTIQPGGPTSPPAYVGARLHAKDVLGTQLWLTTPVDGLRLGYHARRHKDFGGVYPRPDGDQTREVNVSVDGTFERWLARSEWSHINAMGVKLISRYAQLGIRPREFIALNVQTELGDVHVGSNTPAAAVIEMTRDDAVGVNFHFNPTTVLKIEAHQTKGFNLEQVVNMMGVPLKGSYFITSLSVTF